MAEGAKEGGDEGFSFVDKVRLMMYTEQEKEAFLIDKKEKEEKKKGESILTFLYLHLPLFTHTYRASSFTGRKISCTSDIGYFLADLHSFKNWYGT